MGNSLPDMCAEALSRAGEAVEFEGRWYHWPEMKAVADKVTALIAASGAAEGTAVALIARNRPSAIAAEFALVAANRTIKMIYPFQSPTGITANIARLEPAVVIGEAREFAPEVRAEMAARGIAGIVISQMDAAPLDGLERASGNAPQAGGEPRIEILTSGTTGAPKQFPVPFALIAAHHVAPGLGVDRSGAPPVMIFAPLGNISGIYTTFAPLIWGMRGVVWDRFSLDLWLDYVRTYRPVQTGMPCASVQALLDRDVPAADLASIKAMGMGAAPLDPTLQAAFEEKYGIPMLVSYGATEFGGPVTQVTLAHIDEFGFAKRGSVGRPMPGAAVRIIDPDSGEELGADQEGLLEVVSPRIGPQWLRTSDIGLIDSDGFVWLKGRADGAIMRGGFKILPESIERALVTHPAVSDAAVTGVDDTRVGQVPGAAVVLKPGAVADAAELEAHLRTLLMATQIPAHWRFVDTLPKNASAKIDRLALKDLFAKDAA